MKKFLAAGIVMILSFMTAFSGYADQTAISTKLPETTGKARLLVTQDAEVDDKNSLIHTLLYANDFDLEGIVQTSSCFHWSGNDEEEPYRWPGTDWMYDYIDAYEAVYENLIIHDPEYPSPEELRAITVVGNIAAKNDTSVETDGSNLIKERILADDDRPLYIEIGGGANSVARALMSIEEEYKGTDEWESIYDRICENVILLSWGNQDDCYLEYIRPNWIGLRQIDVAKAATGCGYTWPKSKGMPEEGLVKMSGPWMSEYLLSKGPLMEKYNTWYDGKYYEGEVDDQQFGTNLELKMGKTEHVQYDFLSEGDSPAWMYVIPTGLRSTEDLSYGGWGGRYCAKDDEEGVGHRNFAPIKDEPGMAQYMSDIMSDFAMRAEWCVASAYEEANHCPTVSITEGLNFKVAPGETIMLHAEVSDPDGDEVSCQWYQHPYASTCSGQAKIDGADTEEASITVPADAKPGETIHIILRAVDAGGTNPAAYQRVIITVQ